MFAIIESGGKQYKAAKGDILKIEKINAEAGSKVELGNVLLISDGKEGVTIGSPIIEGASVTAEVVAQDRAAKVIVFKKKRRHNYRRKKGHRQNITVLRVSAINATGAAKKEAKAETAEKPKAEKKAPAKKAPAKKTTAKKKED